MRKQTFIMVLGFAEFTVMADNGKPLNTCILLGKEVKKDVHMLLRTTGKAQGKTRGVHS
jgi:hypothetical protein